MIPDLRIFLRSDTFCAWCLFLFGSSNMLHLDFFFFLFFFVMPGKVLAFILFIS